jgi:hypothetical protein
MCSLIPSCNLSKMVSLSKMKAPHPWGAAILALSAFDGTGSAVVGIKTGLGEFIRLRPARTRAVLAAHSSIEVVPPCLPFVNCCPRP